MLLAARKKIGFETSFKCHKVEENYRNNEAWLKWRLKHVQQFSQDWNLFVVVSFQGKEGWAHALSG